MPKTASAPRKTPSNGLTYLIVAAILGLTLLIGLLPDRGSDSVSLHKAPETQQTLPIRTDVPATEPTAAPLLRPTSAPADTGAPSPTATIVPAFMPPEGAPSPSPTQAVLTYVLNTNTRRFHLPGCSSARSIKEKNRSTFTGTREDILELGYKPCGNCHP